MYWQVTPKLTLDMVCMTRLTREPGWVNLWAWKLPPILEEHTGKQVGEPPSAASSQQAQEMLEKLCSQSQHPTPRCWWATLSLCSPQPAAYVVLPNHLLYIYNLSHWQKSSGVVYICCRTINIPMIGTDNWTQHESPFRFRQAPSRFVHTLSSRDASSSGLCSVLSLYFIMCRLQFSC